MNLELRCLQRWIERNIKTIERDKKLHFLTKQEFNKLSNQTATLIHIQKQLIDRKIANG